MTAGEWTGLAGLAFMALAFLADRILKPWRVRVLAEAEEKRTLALIQSEQMQAGLRVLTGTPADENQGLEHVNGIGGRMKAVEEGLARVETALNGGGIGSKIADLGAQNEQLAGDLRETRRDLADAILTLTNNQQRIEEQVDALNETVEHRLFPLEDAERTHRAMLHEVGFDVDLPPDDAA